MKTWTTRTIGLAVLTGLLAGAGGARGQDQQSNQPTGQNTQAAEKTEAAKKEEPRELRIVELEHRRPQEIIQLLNLRNTAQRNQNPAQGAGPTATFFRGRPQNLAIASQENRGLLFLRGTAEDLKDAEKLVKAFDVADEKLEPQKIGDLRVIPIRHGQAAQIQQVLGQLQIPSQMLPLGKTAVIVLAPGDDDTTLKQADEVIKKLDVSDEDRSSDSQRDRQQNNRQQNNQTGQQSNQSGQSGSGQNQP